MKRSLKLAVGLQLFWSTGASRCHRSEILLDIMFQMYCSTWKDKTTTYLLLMGPKSGQLVWYAKYPMNYSLVGGWTNPSEKYESNWIISIGMKNKTCFKPPPSSVLQFQPFPTAHCLWDCPSNPSMTNLSCWHMTGLDGSSKINSRALLQFVTPLRFDSGIKKQEIQNWRKKIAWEKYQRNLLMCLNIWPLWDLKPQAFPGFTTVPVLTMLHYDFQKLWDAKIREKDTQIEQPPKTQEECFGFFQATETRSGRSSYTLGSHISVWFSWFLHLCKAPFSFLCSKNPRSIHRKFMSALFSTFTLVEMQSCFHLRGFGSQIQRQKIGITLWNFETAPQ